jgi:hypothetical protein
MNALLKHAIAGTCPQEFVIREALQEICEDHHATCNIACPIYEKNGNHPLGYEKPWLSNRGCDCFKNGKAMLAYLRSK